MPSRPGSVPSPLDALPRPLADRERRGRTGRRALLVGVAAGIIGTAIAVVVTVQPDVLQRFQPVGAVAGAVPTTTVTSSPASRNQPGVTLPATGDGLVAAAGGGHGSVSTTARPTTSPIPTPTPAPTPMPVTALTGYRWPLPHGRITLPFGPTPWGSRIVEGKPFHDGVDMATFCGDRIVAAHDGVVLAAGRRFDDQLGWLGDLDRYKERLDKKALWSTLPIVIVIDDGNGYRSVYAHFSKVAVKPGQVVRAGQLLGDEGMTGRASGCHLHYGLFSPLETASFRIDPSVAKRMKLPASEIARIDPLKILPPRPKPTPAPTPTPRLTPPA